MSLIVVMNGPEATAGSIRNFFNKIGTDDPIKLDNVIAPNIEQATQNATFKESIKR